MIHAKQDDIKIWEELEFDTKSAIQRVIGFRLEEKIKYMNSFGDKHIFYIENDSQSRWELLKEILK